MNNLNKTIIYTVIFIVASAVIYIIVSTPTEELAAQAREVFTFKNILLLIGYLFSVWVVIWRVEIANKHKIEQQKESQRDVLRLEIFEKLSSATKEANTACMSYTDLTKLASESILELIKIAPKNTPLYTLEEFREKYNKLQISINQLVTTIGQYSIVNRDIEIFYPGYKNCTS